MRAKGVQLSTNINIVVENGMVQEVDGLPDGWTYTIEDLDIERDLNDI